MLLLPLLSSPSGGTLHDLSQTFLAIHIHITESVYRSVRLLKPIHIFSYSGLLIHYIVVLLLTSGGPQEAVVCRR